MLRHVPVTDRSSTRVSLSLSYSFPNLFLFLTPNYSLIVQDFSIGRLGRKPGPDRV